jgi:hypothetical protein
MIIHDSRDYRIEEFTNLPCRFAVDRKERSERGVCLVNIGWAQERGAAFRLMNEDWLNAYASRDGGVGATLSEYASD